MELQIQNMEIRNLGAIGSLSLSFDRRISFVEGSAWQQVLSALRFVLSGDIRQEEFAVFGNNTFISADFLLDRQRCRLELWKNAETGNLERKIIAEERDTQRGLHRYLDDVPERRELRILYDPEKQRILERFSEYESPEDPETEAELFRRTGGLFATETFRCCLGQFRRNEIPEEKLLNEEERQAEAEFFRLNRFWTELEKERGIEGIDASPLTIVIDGKQREKYAGKECLDRLSTAYEGQLLVVLEEPQEGMYRKKPGTEVSLNQEQRKSTAQTNEKERMKQMESVIRHTKENDAAATVAHFLQDEGRDIHFRVFPRMLGDRDLSELELSPRATNCLRRSGKESIGQLADEINGIADLMKIRGTGKKTAQEIMYKLYLFQYMILPEDRKKEYLKEVISLNHLERQVTEG